MKDLLTHLVSLIPMMLLVTQMGSCGNYKNVASSHLDEVKKNISATVLQTWAIKLIAQNQGESQPKHLSLTVVPPGLIKTSSGAPTDVIYMPADTNNEPYIWVLWGGGFGHWGLKLGSPNLQITSSNESYVLLWQAGLYAWHEIQ